MAWYHGMVESLDYAEAQRSRDGRAMPPVEPAFDQARPPRPLREERARTHNELPTSAIGGELDLDLLPVDIGRSEGRRHSPELS